MNRKRTHTGNEKKLLSRFGGRILFLSNGAMLGLLLGMVFQPLWDKKPVMSYGSGVWEEGSISTADTVTGEESQKEQTQEEKICYLTFDDGPSGVTVRILDILKEYNAKATFFVIGNSLTEENKPIVKRILQEGHAIGLHANNHSYEDFYENETSWKEDWGILYKRLEKEYGITPGLFRFPGGSACTYMKGRVQDHIKWMHEKGLRCFDWNVSGEDAVGNPTSYSIYENVINGAIKYNTPIVLLHDSSVSQKTADALPEILRDLTKRGYRYETLEKRKEYIFKNSR